MPSWGTVDQASSSPKFGAALLDVGSGNAAEAANTTALYQNTTGSAFVSKQVVGEFGVSNVHMANTGGEAKRINHTGWNLRRAGTGPVANVVPLVGGTGYANTDLIKVSGGSVNAAGTLVTNSTGGITATTLTNGGSGFINVSASTVAVTNATGGASGGSSGTFTLTLGGRAGRVAYETIVAGGITSGTNTVIFPL